jgi:hypothetical protein
MIRRYTDYEIPIDALRVIINKSLILPLIILINGHSQIGKSLFLFHLANRIKQILLGIPKGFETWKEWDWKKYCTTTPKQFVKTYDESNNQIIALEEAGEQLNFYEWFSIMNQVFSTISRTQGVKRNICMLITPFANDLQKQQKRKIDFVLWVAKKWEHKRMARVVPRYVKVDYLSLKEDNYSLRYIKNWTIRYQREELRLSNHYTDWLRYTLKSEVMDDIKEKVGIYNPNRPISEKNMPDWVKKLL